VRTLRQWLGVELDEVSWKDRVVAVVGGIVGILAVVGITHHAIGLDGAQLLVASMGSSAVLLFAIPHGQMSQPWAVLVGHSVSALIGVSCAKAISNTEIAAACAVGLAIGAMHQLKCLHPPGGATALTAVIGGHAVTSLGYRFVAAPVLLDAAVIVFVAVLVNALFSWRRYPAHLGRRQSQAVGESVPSHDQILEALRSMDVFIDANEDDLIKLHRLLVASATERA
jgi:CBS-domain-containing membrane protein